MSDYIDFKVDDRVVITAGTYAGREGKIMKKCSTAFSDWIHVLLDLKKRERVQKKVMVEKKYLELICE